MGAPECTTTCSGDERFTKFHARNSYTIQGPRHMQKELVQHGPIQIAFKVYRSFMSYKKGIYHKLKQETSPEGGHAVKLVGYGVEDDQKYWTGLTAGTPIGAKRASSGSGVATTS